MSSCIFGEKNPQVHLIITRERTKNNPSHNLRNFHNFPPWGNLFEPLKSRQGRVCQNWKLAIVWGEVVRVKRLIFHIKKYFFASSQIILALNSMSTSCATRTVDYKGYSFCRIKQELNISLKIGECCCYVLFEKLRLIKHGSMNISEPFQSAIYFHRWQTVLFW